MFLRLCSRLESLQVTFFRTHTQIHTYIHHSGRSYEAQSVSQEKSKLMNWSCYFISLEIPTISVKCVFPASKKVRCCVRRCILPAGICAKGEVVEAPGKICFSRSVFSSISSAFKGVARSLILTQTDGRAELSKRARQNCLSAICLWAIERIFVILSFFRLPLPPSFLSYFLCGCCWVMPASEWHFSILRGLGGVRLEAGDKTSCCCQGSFRNCLPSGSNISKWQKIGKITFKSMRKALNFYKLKFEFNFTQI